MRVAWLLLLARGQRAWRAEWIHGAMNTSANTKPVCATSNGVGFFLACPAGVIESIPFASYADAWVFHCVQA